VKLILQKTKPATEVTGEISATSYKRICERLKGFSKKELWQVLDHYIFHQLQDQNIDELITILNQMEETGQPVTAQAFNEAAQQIIEKNPNSSEEGPRELRAHKEKRPPSDEELNLSKNVMDILYDENYFKTYLKPEVRAETAKRLISFCDEKGIPKADHWSSFASGEGEEE
jgi:hypothetical protein